MVETILTMVMEDTMEVMEDMVMAVMVVMAMVVATHTGVKAMVVTVTIHTIMVASDFTASHMARLDTWHVMKRTNISITLQQAQR